MECSPHGAKMHSLALRQAWIFRSNGVADLVGLAGFGEGRMATWGSLLVNPWRGILLVAERRSGRGGLD